MEMNQAPMKLLASTIPLCSLTQQAGTLISIGDRQEVLNMSLQSGDPMGHKKNTIGAANFMLLLASILWMDASSAASNKKLEEMMSYDGLQKISVKGIDLAYARPGATLAGYNKVQIDPVEVSFHKDWDPDKTGTRFKLSTAERERIRTGVANLVYEEFTKELQSKSSYQVVTTAGADVLRVRPIIANLYVNAPDTMSAGRSRTYVSSAGEMTLLAELYDSETGEVLARVMDRRQASEDMGLQFTNSVFNVAEARGIATSWAKILRNGLDKAHGFGKK